MNETLEKILNLIDRTNIISLGDSHSRFYEGIDMIEWKWIGPALAYNINEDISTNNTKAQILGILEQTDPSKTAIILSFGEIDLRVHVIKRTEIENISLEESSIRVAKKYIEMIEYIVGRGYKVFINGPHAAGTAYNPEYPYYGSMENRNTAILIFNSYLEKYCDSKQIPFISLFDIVVDHNTNKTNNEYILDGCHLNIVPELQEIALSKFLTKLENFYHIYK